MGMCQSSGSKRGNGAFPDTITLPGPAQQLDMGDGHRRPQGYQQQQPPQYQQQQQQQHYQQQQRQAPRGASAYDVHPNAADRRSKPGPAPRNGAHDRRQPPHDNYRGDPARPRNGSQPKPRQPPQQQQQYHQQQHKYEPPRNGSGGNQPNGHRAHGTPPAANGASAASDKNADALNRSRQVAARVLAEFQANPALGRERIPYSSLYFTRVLSKGAFGEVWLAQLENRQVAVKRILNEKKNDEKEIECFGAEIKLMASFSHPKIVEFVGVSWSATNDLCAVTEYMAKGDLYGFLKRRVGQLNWRDHKVFLAEDVADALGYLHGLAPKVIHRDLKSKNILLDDAFRAKLSDFGISRERSVEDTMTAGVGTIYWTAPEVLMGKKYTEKADIYSFGIVMSELDTHQVPYSDKRDDSGKKLQGMKIVQMVIKRNLRPTLAGDCPKPVRDLAMRCMDSDPDVRPDAPELLRLIQRLQTQL